MSGEPVVIEVGNTKDVTIPQAFIDWMEENAWTQTHDDWHRIRRWDQNCRKSNAPASGCAWAEGLLSRGLWRASIQENAPGDGYAFLVMHRHMIEGIKQAFPKHAQFFSGFKHVPLSKSDPENPTNWREVTWTENQKIAIDKLQNIEAHIGEFATEDDLARYMQAPFVWTEQNPSQATGDATAGLHFMLHAQWSVPGSPALLGDGRGVVNNYVFWKLHGWLDDVWERYRVAKGITREDPRYKEEMYVQCKEMHQLDERNLKPNGSENEAGPSNETGFFAENVRPIFDRRCAACHGAQSQFAGLALGGTGLSSTRVVSGVVGVLATNGAYSLVERGNPARSWLYLKAADQAATVACTGCATGPMPPAGDRMTANELAMLAQWITDGAEGPK